jgi:GR25 family glycosyltransferase involved in LPS biosynthesis
MTNPRQVFDRIYCVSLPRSADRRRHAARELQSVGWGDFRFFDATDQDSLLVSAARAQGLVAEFPPCFRCGQRICSCPNNVLIDAQVATFITFKRLWEEIVADDVGVALVVEDDVKFTDYAPQLIAAAFTPEGFAQCSLRRESEALLRLGWARSADHAWNGTHTFIPGVLRMANPACVLTNALARRLLASFQRFDTTADIFLHERVGLNVTNHLLMPPLAFELSMSTGEFESLIHPRAARVDYLRKTQPPDSPVVAAAEQRLARHHKHITPKDLLVVGHPRCGSGYMAALLAAFGLDVGHERMGAHGISSWMFAADDEEYPFAANPEAQTRRDKHFAVIIEHVRNPAEAIPSIIVENENSAASYQFRRRHLLGELGFDLDSAAHPVERAALALLGWHTLITRLQPQLTVRIEDGEDALRRFLVTRGFVSDAFHPAALPPKNANTRKPYQGVIIEKPALQAADWAGISPGTRERLQEFCRQHGYPSLP